MNRARIASVLALAFGAVALWPAAAGAQQAPPSFQGLFNGTGTRARAHSTWVSFSVEAADDRNDTSSDANARVIPPRTYSDALGEIHFDRNFHAFSLTASGSAALRADTASGANAALLKNVISAALTSVPQRRTGFRFAATRVDAPYTLLTLEGPTSLESGDLVAAASDHFLTNQRVVIQSASAGISQRLGRRTTVSADYDVRLATGFAGLADLTTERGTARVERQLTKSLWANGGYSYQFGSYSRAGDGNLNSREAEAGVEYKPRAGRLQFGFGAGSADVQEAGRNGRHATGYARVDRAIGRAWSVHSEYRRGVDMAAGFDRPLIADSGTVSVGGFVNKRVDVLGFAGVWLTRAATTGVAGYHSQRIGGRVRVALSRMFAVYGEYLHYEYRFDPLAQVPLSLSNNFVRRGVRFGVVSRLPLFR